MVRLLSTVDGRSKVNVSSSLKYMLHGLSQHIVCLCKIILILLSDLKDISIKIQRVIKYTLPRSYKKVTVAKHVAERQCLISHRMSKNDKLYFRIDDKEKLRLDHYHSDDSKSCKSHIQ